MTAVALLADLNDELRNAREMAPRLQELSGSNGLTNHQIDVATNAICLSVHVAFERFVRDLFYACTLGTSGIEGVRSRVPRLGDDSVSALVLGGRDYVEWLPIKKTMDRAATFLQMGQPFVRLWGRSLVLDRLTHLQIVRNRLAHSGEKADTQYRKLSRGEAAFEEPARWLQFTRSSGAKSNLLLILDAIQLSAQALASDDRTPVALGAAVVEGEASAAPGKYKCLSCDLTKHTAEWGALGTCSRCLAADGGAHQCASCGKGQLKSRWRLEKLRSR